MIPTQVAHIMSLVDDYAWAKSNGVGVRDGKGKYSRAAVEAALRDAPTQASQPLTAQEVEAIIARHDYQIHGDRARYIVRMTEQAHGIGAAQKGKP